MKDSGCEWLSVTHTSTENLPDWLTEAIRKTRSSALPGQLPLLLVHEEDTWHGNDLVIIKVADFRDFFRNS